MSSYLILSGVPEIMAVSYFYVLKIQFSGNCLEKYIKLKRIQFCTRKCIRLFRIFTCIDLTKLNLCDRYWTNFLSSNLKKFDFSRSGCRFEGFFCTKTFQCLALTYSPNRSIQACLIYF